MAETPKQSEQSMEEILQSIKRIIAEEGDDTVVASDVDGDVLELTDRVPDEDTAGVKDGGAVAPMSVDALLDSLADPAHVAPAAVAEEPKEEAPLQPETVSALEAIEGMLSEMTATTPAPEPAPQPAPQPAPAPSFGEEGIASQKTLAASAAALKQLQPEPEQPREFHAERIAFRSGMTIEDLVLETLRPMLREWVDSNMPGMVERMVAREISKIRSQF